MSGLTAAERFARYMHQPPAWAGSELLDDWHTLRGSRYKVTQEWTERNAGQWDTWFEVCTDAQRRRIRKKRRREQVTP